MQVLHYDSNKTLRIKIKSGIENARVELYWRERNRRIINLKGINEETLVYVPSQDIHEQLGIITSLYQSLSVTD